MREIRIKVSDARGRQWAYFLRRRFGRDRRTPLERLVQMTVLQAVMAEAEKLVEETRTCTEEAEDDR